MSKKKNDPPWDQGVFRGASLVGTPYELGFDREGELWRHVAFSAIVGLSL